MQNAEARKNFCPLGEHGRMFGPYRQKVNIGDP